MSKLSITDLSLGGKKVLMRVDFNVPLDEQGKITDDTRIVAALPSIRYVLDHGGSLLLMSHLGRPKGRVDKASSLRPCALRLSELLGRPVPLAPDCVGEETASLAKKLLPGQLLMLENLRFHRGEEKPEEESNFTSQLAALGDLYINDAFGTAHRSHASTALLAKEFPGRAAAGFLMEKELQFLGDSLLHPNRPFMAILGGAKISTKLGVVRSLLHKVDLLMIGGAMAYTLSKAQGMAIGDSLCEEGMMEEARAILSEASRQKGKLLLPVDALVVPSQVVPSQGDSKETKVATFPPGIAPGFQGVDIGPETLSLFQQHMKKAATLLWNGPLGIFEVDAFAKGTEGIARTLTSLSATTVVGGGDSAAALQKLGLADKVTHLSTGGGASLEYIEYGTLPGIETLSDAVVAATH